MKNRTRVLALLLSLLLVLSLTACAGPAEEDVPVEDPIPEDTLSADETEEDAYLAELDAQIEQERYEREHWYEFADCITTGTIEQDGVAVDVCVYVNEDGFAFCYDEGSGHDLFETAPFPYTLTDAQEDLTGVSFDDLDGDGNSDITAAFHHSGGDDRTEVWYWDTGKLAFVYSEEDSVYDDHGQGEITRAAEKAALEPYVGLWKQDSQELYLRVYEDNTWESYDELGVIHEGTCYGDDGELDLYIADLSGISGIFLELSDDGSLLHPESGDRFVRADES